MHVTALLILSVLAPAPAPDLEVDLSQDVVVVPFDHTSRHVAVEVRINGKGPFRFQVDTYATIDACIDDDVAEELGLKTVRTVTNSDGRTSQERAVVSIEELTLGGATFRDMDALVDDYDWIAGGERGVDGLIGFDAFRDLLVTFDYPRSRLVLTRGRIEPDAPHAIPLLLSNGAPDVHLVVGDRRLLFGLDTGASSSLALFKQDAEVLPLSGALREVGRGRTVYSEFIVYGAQLAVPVTFAGQTLERPEVTFSEGSSKRLVGYGLFRGFEVTFDTRSRLVRFVRPD